MALLAQPFAYGDGEMSFAETGYSQDQKILQVLEESALAVLSTSWFFALSSFSTVPFNSAATTRVGSRMTAKSVVASFFIIIHPFRCEFFRSWNYPRSDLRSPPMFLAPNAAPFSRVVSGPPLQPAITISPASEIVGITLQMSAWHSYRFFPFVRLRSRPKCFLNIGLKSQLATPSIPLPGDPHKGAYSSLPRSPRHSRRGD